MMVPVLGGILCLRITRSILLCLDLVPRTEAALFEDVPVSAPNGLPTSNEEDYDVPE